MRLGWPHQRAAGPPSAESFQPAGWRADVLLPCDDLRSHALLWPGVPPLPPAPLLSFSFRVILSPPQLPLWPVTVAATFRLGHCPPGRPVVCRFGIVRPGGNLKLAGCPSPSLPQIRDS